MNIPAVRIWVGEGVGTAFLVMAVIGSGIMAERLAGGNAAVALLANSIATGAALLALIVAFGPVAGAHFNPVVSLMEAIRGNLHWRVTAIYIFVQFAGAVSGVFLTHFMFGEPIVQFSGQVRTGPAQWLGEIIATFGLALVIGLCASRRTETVACVVAGYITAAYWFTSSTSFANPAVTTARALTDTFTGIRPGDVPEFILAQLLGGLAAAYLVRRLVRTGSNIAR